MTTNIPHPIDVYVGQKLRERRTILGISQEEIGNKTGISFQQIQKYEQGINRISASRLWQFAEILSVEVTYFYEGLFSKIPENYPHDFADYSDNLRLIKSFRKISDIVIRKKILSLVTSLGEKLAIPER